ncbi:hypothetical protein V5799_023339 [Amblyomma americanum]|uniref:Uncharacterized protein n=1 Tax=Amblyomma americanum TaxID=6943 RepID=A0AAQ4FJM2_AMBAM
MEHYMSHNYGLKSPARQQAVTTALAIHGVVFAAWAPKVVDIAVCASLILVSVPLPETFKAPLPDTLHEIKQARWHFFCRNQSSPSRQRDRRRCSTNRR